MRATTVARHASARPIGLRCWVSVLSRHRTYVLLLLLVKRKVLVYRPLLDDPVRGRILRSEHAIVEVRDHRAAHHRVPA